jgi:hypothetical protein
VVEVYAILFTVTFHAVPAGRPTSSKVSFWHVGSAALMQAGLNVPGIVVVIIFPVGIVTVTGAPGTDGPHPIDRPVTSGHVIAASGTCSCFVPFSAVVWAPQNPKVTPTMISNKENAINLFQLLIISPLLVSVAVFLIISLYNWNNIITHVFIYIVT